MTMDAAGGHMKGVHKVYNYFDKIVTIYTSEHTCILCEEKVTRNRDMIRRHARASHKISFAEYEEKFKAFNSKALEKVASPAKKKITEKKSGPKKTNNTLRVVGAAKATPRVQGPAADWANDCTYACNLCDKVHKI